MSTSTAPDVDRVVVRMGRSAFAYRSFPSPVDEAGNTPPGPDPAADAASTSDGTPLAVLFSLVGDALPDTSKSTAVKSAAVKSAAVRSAAVRSAAVIPPAVPVAPANPFLVRPQPLPVLPDAHPAEACSTGLPEMFALLSGAVRSGGAPRPPSHGGSGPAFPFRRR